MACLLARAGENQQQQNPNCPLQTNEKSVLTREFLQHRLVQPHPAFEILEREILVRRMRTAIGQRESHQQRFHSENAAELRDDREYFRLRE